MQTRSVTVTIITALLLAATLALQAGCGSQYIKGANDIPLYPHAKLQAFYSGPTLDAANPYKAETYAVYTSRDSQKVIADYYLKNLPRNGWVWVGEKGFNIYSKSKPQIKQLKINTFPGENKETRVGFHIFKDMGEPNK